MNNSDSQSPNIETLLARARSAEKEGCYTTASELFQLALNLDPSRDSALYRAARNLLELGRFSKAQELLVKIRLEQAPRHWLVELIFGELRMAQFKPLEAEEHFRKAVSLNPSSTTPAVFLADCLTKQEKFENASEVLLKAIAAEGDVDEVYLNLGIVARAQGNYEEARAYLAKAIEIAPDDSRAREVLADVEHWLREKEHMPPDKA